MEPPPAGPLENDDANPCFGCGPGNAAGLRLAFTKVDGRVTSVLVAEPAYAGWPERLHSGVLYTAMLEVANWTFYATEGRMALPLQTSALRPSGWVPVGQRLVLTGSPGPREGDQRTVTVRAAVEHGAEVASLDRTYLVADRATFVKRMGYDRLPEVLEDLIPE